MKRKYIWLIVSCLMVAVLLLASCKGPAEKKEKGGTITSFTTYFPVSWDGEDIHSHTYYFTNFIYDHLVITDWWSDRSISDLSARYDYLNNPQLWVGHLAESWDWSDPLTMTFKIRKGVKWQNKPPANGREFVADDVVWQFERMLANPKRAEQIIHNIKSVTATDKYTVVFKLKEPYVLMLREIGAVVYIECPDVVKEYGDLREWRNLVGTGPWMITDFVPDTSVTYKRNPDYFLKDPDGNRLPYADGAKFLIITDIATQMAALRTAKVDKTYVFDPVPWDQKISLEQTNPDMKFKMTPAGGLVNMWLRNIKEPFTDIRVRQALAMVIKRQELVDTLLRGSGHPFAWPAAPGWPSYTPVEELPAHIRQIYDWKPENVEKAKQLLAEAGYPDGFKTSVQYNVGAGAVPLEPAFPLIKNWWAEIGVDLELLPADRGTASYLRQYPFPYDNILAVGGGQESPLKVIEGKYRTGGPWNRALVSDPVIDNLFEKAGKEFDFEKRTAIFKEVFQYISEQCYDITFPQIWNYQAWHPWVKGFDGETNIGVKSEGHIMSRIWLDLDLKEEMTGKR